MAKEAKTANGRRPTKPGGAKGLRIKRPTKKVLPSEEVVTRDYNSRLRASNSLAEEIRFILRGETERTGIKVHEIEARVKELASVIKKMRDKEYEGLEKVGDLVGGRVVCLFRSDLNLVKGIIEKQFQVDEFDDKYLNDPTAFGYMSLHFQCRLRQDFSGPRYDALKSISFEIQLRTICMHAWSAVQHYLEYKGDWDVPSHLKKDINALSALFYVADSQFEAAYAAKLDASSQATESIAQNNISSEPINLDTVEAFIINKFPNRSTGGAESISKLVQELAQADYKTLDEVAKDLDRAEKEFTSYEDSRGLVFFTGTGVVRISLGIASEVFRGVVYSADHGFDKYQHLVENNI